jgi:hypothetical protein
MAAGTASWLIGSHASWPSTTVTINATPYEITASSTGLYLYHTTDALNFMVQLKTHMDTEAGGTNVVRLNASGKMYIASDFIGGITIAWTDALGKTFSGFTQGNLSSSANYTADDVSPFLFMPGGTETALLGRLGTPGRPVPDIVAGVSRDGTTRARQLGEQKVERLRFPNVEVARYWDASDEARHFLGWWKNVGAPMRKFFHWRQVAEDDASTSAVTLSTSLGPYSVDVEQSGGQVPGRRSGGTNLVEKLYDVEFPCFITPEYA